MDSLPVELVGVIAEHLDDASHFSFRLASKRHYKSQIPRIHNIDNSVIELALQESQNGNLLPWLFRNIKIGPQRVVSPDDTQFEYGPWKLSRFLIREYCASICLLNNNISLFMELNAIRRPLDLSCKWIWFGLGSIGEVSILEDLLSYLDPGAIEIENSINFLSAALRFNRMTVVNWFVNQSRIPRPTFNGYFELDFYPQAVQRALSATAFLPNITAGDLNSILHIIKTTGAYVTQSTVILAAQLGIEALVPSLPNSNFRHPEPFKAAMKGGHVDMIDHLLKHNYFYQKERYLRDAVGYCSVEMAKKLVAVGFETNPDNIMVTALLNPKREMWDYCFTELGGKLDDSCYLTIIENKTNFSATFEWLERNNCPKPTDEELLKMVLRRGHVDCLRYLSKKGIKLTEDYQASVFSASFGFVEYFLKENPDFGITDEYFKYFLRFDRRRLSSPLLDQIGYKFTKNSLITVLKYSDPYVINQWTRVIASRCPELIDDDVLDAARNSESGHALDILLEFKK